jgi:mRNA-degrading endonuclease toxin of MazEF toxin-antitoxin module
MASFPRRGEIWLVDFPDDPKSRPALIVSLNACNEYSDSVLAVPVTTNPRPSPHARRIACKTGRFDTRFNGPLRKRQLPAQVAALPWPTRRHHQPRIDARSRTLPAQITWHHRVASANKTAPR